ncbi:MAG: tRNA (5-methylaminomethyl-2-thiouridine)(34)-methyltransferase MnmD [Imperialibacter sp.]|uniref:tRNA (5-methylaminomethyl-2-thiouridine)(34)-methyltransferase MnmD n=1 Tax=Imperialibacter sp. TaxID=2038411 RepID=UPI0030DC6C9C|tara:strand:- start:173 stop:850 length:678 start_codon:yes stop_codon:yes gene_type:complete
MDSNVHLILTDDGSHSLKNEALNETYHSFHGAVQESAHVFIEMGLRHWCNQHKGAARILEIGFGTGLNAYLSLIFAKEHARTVAFETLETFPLPTEIYENLNYADLIGEGDLPKYFRLLHSSDWGKPVEITPHFFLKKLETPVHDYSSTTPFNIIYFDAFAPNKQPEMWTMEVIQKMYDSLAPGGFLVTYCAQGQFKRNLKQAGFTVEELPGPPGKKEMVRAVKK